MGRAKLKMELIENEKARNTTFKKRKEGLIRKLTEFTTLCDVNACMIIYGPNQTRPDLWPPHDPDQVRRIIDLYKSKNTDAAGTKSFGVVDLFQGRKKQIEEELEKLRRKNLEAKYPTRPDLLNALDEAHLRQLHAFLTAKASYVRSRIQLLRMNQQDHRIMNPKVEMVIDHRRVLHNSMMMAGSSSNSNVQLKREFYYESATGYYQQYMVPPLLPRPYLLQAMVQPQLQYLANQDELMMRNQDGFKYEDLTTKFSY
ncbi:MADS-box transcription factor PHERES 1-like [Salvia hispanica]|uniref:MADS-box transcription factor PHERES 1-like n=1 Tax=Salvia hispanica TaxID=49212 RepID=UPI002009B9C1|nr:MADS-box transcription factor PHERES 1-like [Salvia hispanica]